MSQIVLYFLHNTSVLSFYLDIVLTLSIHNIYQWRCQSKNWWQYKSMTISIDVHPHYHHYLHYHHHHHHDSHHKYQSHIITIHNNGDKAKINGNLAVWQFHLNNTSIIIIMIIIIMIIMIIITMRVKTTITLLISSVKHVYDNRRNVHKPSINKNIDNIMIICHCSQQSHHYQHNHMSHDIHQSKYRWQYNSMTISIDHHHYHFHYHYYHHHHHHHHHLHPRRRRRHSSHCHRYHHHHFILLVIIMVVSISIVLMLTVILMTI